MLYRNCSDTTFIDAKADVNMVDKDGVSALHLAAKGGFIEIAKALIDARADGCQYG